MYYHVRKIYYNVFALVKWIFRIYMYHDTVERVYSTLQRFAFPTPTKPCWNFHKIWKKNFLWKPVFVNIFLIHFLYSDRLKTLDLSRANFPQIPVNAKLPQIQNCCRSSSTLALQLPKYSHDKYSSFFTVCAVAAFLKH